MKIYTTENNDLNNITLNDTAFLTNQSINNDPVDEERVCEENNSSSENTQQKDNEVSVKENISNPTLSTSLSAWGLPENILTKYKHRGINDMFFWQAECLGNQKILIENCNLVYSAPTSAGKTLVAEILALKTVIERQKKVIIILPFVSVVREKMFYFQDILSTSGIRVEGFMGSHNPPGGFKAVQLAICTIEKANGIVNRLLEENSLSDIGAVIIDEMHLLGDPSRGYLLELLLTKLRYMSSRNKDINIQLIGMSATLPNLELLAKWLNAELYITEFRPIPLHEFCVVSGEIYNPELKLQRRLKPVAELTEDSDNILQLCLETISLSCSVLIFCPTKNWCENLAQQISVAFWKLGRSSSKLGQCLREQLNSTAISELIEQLQRCPVGLDSILKKTISFGVAFHHAGLTMDERDIIEGAFRSGALRVLVATSTLSSGVNLPARRVIIRTPMFHGKPIDTLTYRQMIGRAGRMGKDSAGESILVCQKNDKRVASELMSAKLRPIESCLEGAGKLKRAILEVIASGVATSPDDVRLFTSCTLLAASEDEEVGINNPIEQAVEFLLSNEFIRLQKTEEGVLKYVATSLAKACLSSSLPPEDGLALFEEIEKARKCFVLDTELHLLYLVTPYSVCSQWSNLDWMLYLDFWEKLPSSMKRVAELVGVRESYIFNATRGKINTSTLKLYHKLQIHRRFYTALALQDLVNEIPLNEVADKYRCSRGMLQSLQQSASMFAGMVTSFCHKLGWKCVEILVSQFQDRLQFGISHELLDLMKLPLLNGPRARALYNAGLEMLADLASCDVCKLENVLYSSVPFQSEKERDGETAYDVEQKKKMRSIWITGKQGLTAREAAETLIKDARKYLQLEMGAAVVKWETSNSNKNESDSSSSLSEASTSISRDINVRNIEDCDLNIHIDTNTSNVADFNNKECNKSVTLNNHACKVENPDQNLTVKQTENGSNSIKNTDERKSEQNLGLNQIESDSSAMPNINKVLDNKYNNASYVNTANNVEIFSNNNESVSSTDAEVCDISILNINESTPIRSILEKTNGTLYTENSFNNYKTPETNNIANDEQISAEDDDNNLFDYNWTPLGNEIPSFSANTSNRSVNMSLLNKTGKQDELKVNDSLLNASSKSGSLFEESLTLDSKLYNALDCSIQNNTTSNGTKDSLSLDSKLYDDLDCLIQNNSIPNGTEQCLTLDSKLYNALDCPIQINTTSNGTEDSLTLDSKLYDALDCPTQNNSIPNGTEDSLILEALDCPIQNITILNGIDSLKNNNNYNHERNSVINNNQVTDNESQKNTFNDIEMENTSFFDQAFADTFNISDPNSNKVCEILNKTGSSTSDIVENSQAEATNCSNTLYNINGSVKTFKKRSRYTPQKRGRNEENTYSDILNESMLIETPKKKKKYSKKNKLPESQVLKQKNINDDNTNEEIENTLSLSSQIKPENSTAVNLGSLNIVDVCKNKQLFHIFCAELKAKSNISLAVACEHIKEEKPVIGQNVIKTPIKDKKSTSNLGIVVGERHITGIALTWGENTVYYLSFTDKEIVNNHDKLELIKRILNNKHYKVRIFDAKEQCKVLYNSCKCTVNCSLEDPKVADWLLEPEGKEKNLQAMALKYSPESVGLAQLAGSCKGIGSVALDLQSAILSRIRASVETIVTWHIIESQNDILREQDPKLLETFNTEMNSINCLTWMELVGLGVDNIRINNLVDTLQEQMASLQQQAFSLAGRRFSFASSKDVAKVLGLYKGKKVSTNKQTLELNENPISNLIQQWRKLSCTLTKMMFPIVRALKDDRIHGICVTYSATGRISMHEPNLQNVPRNFDIVKSDKSVVHLSVRASFVPEKGNVFLSADYCQLELRILAHLSQDSVLCKIMRSDADVFKLIAAKLNRIKETQVTDTLRQRAKQLCYGIIYGMGGKALSEQMNSSEEEAHEFMNTFKNTYPGINKYIQRTIELCRDNGYVETLAGRRRYLPHINNGNIAIKSQAERQAVNTTIQGSAADIAKKAMIIIDNRLRKLFPSKVNLNKSRIPLVLHLHDELLYEVPFADLCLASKLVKGAMEEVVNLSIPFPVKLKSGSSWGELEEFNTTE